MIWVARDVSIQLSTFRYKWRFKTTRFQYSRIIQRLSQSFLFYVLNERDNFLLQSNKFESLSKNMKPSNFFQLRASKCSWKTFDEKNNYHSWIGILLAFENHISFILVQKGKVINS